jgi:hypothetical protein
LQTLCRFEETAPRCNNPAPRRNVKSAILLVAALAGAIAAAGGAGLSETRPRHTVTPRAAAPPGEATREQAGEAREQAEALLARAADLTNLMAPGSPPFRLRATVDVAGLKHGVANGVYLLVWAAPDRYREEIGLPGFNQSIVVTDGKLWRRRDLDYVPLRAMQLRSLLSIPIHLDRNPAGGLSLSQRRAGGVRADCAEIQEGPSRRRMCVDPATGLPIFVEYSAPAAPGRWEFSDYAPVGGRRFPRVLRIVVGSKPLITVHVDLLEPAASLNPATFSPPEGSEAHAWCAAPSPPIEIPDPWTRLALPIPDLKGGRVTVYFIVGTDGKPHDAHVVESLNPVMDDWFLQTVLRRRYKPASCGGEAIEHEAIDGMEITAR